MTVEDWYEKMERQLAEDAERSRREHEEDLRILQAAQRNIDALSVNIASVNIASADASGFQSWMEDFERRAEESRERDRRLGERIDALISAIGIYLSKQNPQA